MTILQLIPAVATHRGMRRRHNEDAVGYDYPSNIDVLKSYGSLFMVADGVGGLSAGDKASQMTVEQLKKHYYRSDVSQSIEQGLVNAIQQVNRDVFLEFNSKGATTLVAVVIVGDQMISASVGDSQIFKITDNSITQLNEEDVLHSDDADNGALTKAIGYREDLDLTVFRHTLQLNQKILLCSDGLTRYLDTQQLSKLAQMRDPRDAVRRMINAANNAGGADNVSALLVNIGDTMPEEDLAEHLGRISVRVAVDTDPMMMQDVPSKPHTQIPLSRPETIIDEDLLNQAEALTPLIEERIVSTPAKQTAPKPNNNIIIIAVAIAILVVGAVIFGFALTSLGNNSNPQQSAPTSQDNIIPDAAQIQVGDVILLETVILTKNTIGSDIGSFLTSPNTSYFIETITEDSTGQLWYLLLEETTEQTGWLVESDLPAYTMQND